MKKKAKVLKFPRVPVPKPGRVHTPKPKRKPKHKTSFDRLDDLYQD